MTDVPSERKRKSSRFLILLALAAVVVALIAWWASRDSNDGPATGVTETGVPVFEGTDPVTLGSGTTSREVPGAPDSGAPAGALPAGDGVTGALPDTSAGEAPLAAPADQVAPQ
jgi:hypothetical protein